MNWFFTLSLQAFNYPTDNHKPSTYWMIEIASYITEILLFIILLNYSILNVFIFSLRIFFLNSSLIKILMKFGYFILFTFYYQLDFLNTALIFNQKSLKSKNLKDLLIEIKSVLIQELLNSPIVASDEITSYFYRHKLKNDFRVELFNLLESKIGSNEYFSVNVAIFKNLNYLVKVFIKNDPILTTREKAILVCIGLKLEQQLELSSYEFHPLNKSSSNIDLITSLKLFGINWDSFPQFGLNENPCKNKNLTYQRHPYDFVNLFETKIRQLSTLILYFHSCFSVEDTYSKLYGNKKAIKKIWLHYNEITTNPIDIISWLNFHLLVSLWELSYDEVLLSLKTIKIPKFFLINIRNDAGFKNLIKFGSYLKQNYPDKRIIKLILTDGGNQEFSDTINMGVKYSVQNQVIELPKKPKTFKQLHDFFQIYGRYGNELHKVLNQNSILHLETENFKTYTIKIPKTRKDLLIVGCKLLICVGSSDIYTHKIANKESFIIFLYKNNDPKYCIEICQNTLSIRQAKGLYNHMLDRLEIIELHNFLKEKIELQNTILI